MFQSQTTSTPIPAIRVAQAGRQMSFLAALAVSAIVLPQPVRGDEAVAKVSIVAKNLSNKQADTVREALTAAGLSVLPGMSPALAEKLAVADLVGDDAPGASEMTDVDYVFFAEAYSTEDADLTRVSWVDVRQGGVTAVRVMSADDLKSGVQALLADIRRKQEHTVADAAQTAEAVSVEARARGHAKKGASGNAAKIVALMDAKRMAVERAYGAKVSVEQLPNGKKVVAGAAGSLSYKIVETGTDDFGPYIDIMAKVSVPKSLIEKAPAQQKYPTETGAQPYVNKSDSGTVDWEKGVVTARGVAKVTVG